MKPAFTAAFCIAATIFIPALVFIALEFSIGVAYFRGACLAIVRTASEPIILSRIEASHRRGKGGHSPRFILAELTGQPFISDIILNRDDGFGFKAVYDLVLLCEEPDTEFPGYHPALDSYIWMENHGAPLFLRHLASK